MNSRESGPRLCAKYECQQFRCNIPNECVGSQDISSPHLNPRPAGPLDFPPPMGGGGRLNAPPPFCLVAVEKNERQRSKASEKSFRNHFGHFMAQVKIGVPGVKIPKISQNGFSTMKSLILKIEQRICTIVFISLRRVESYIK